MTLVHRVRYWLLDHYYTWRWLHVYQPQRYTDVAITGWLSALARKEEP